MAFTELFDRLLHIQPTRSCYADVLYYSDVKSRVEHINGKVCEVRPSDNGNHQLVISKGFGKVIIDNSTLVMRCVITDRDGTSLFTYSIGGLL